MGNGRSWSKSDWDRYKTTKKVDYSKAKTVSDVYKSSYVKSSYLPRNVARESRDSELHPNSSAIVIGLDTTGSMGSVVVNIAKKLETTVGEIFERLPVTDPQIMFSFIDDSFAYDDPLQVTQFEVDTKIAEQLTDMHFTGYGGGNDFESYPLLWYFCSRHTEIDCYEKRHKKGFLITIGDDGYPEKLTATEIKRVFGDDVSGDIKTDELLAEINKKYEVFHMCVVEGGSYSEKDFNKWKNLIGSHAIKVSDYSKIPEIIVSLLQVHSGASINDVASSWDGSTGLVVREALKGVVSTVTGDTGLIEF